MQRQECQSSQKSPTETVRYDDRMKSIDDKTNSANYSNNRQE